jgi:hypothetical protein
MTTTTTKATAVRTILALDLGKYKTVACAYHPGTTAARFDTLTTFARTTPQALRPRAARRYRHRGLSAGWLGPRPVPRTRPALPRR